MPDYKKSTSRYTRLYQARFRGRVCNPNKKPRQVSSKESNLKSEALKSLDEFRGALDLALNNPEAGEKKATKHPLKDAKLERQRLVAEAGGGPFYSCYHGVVWHREGSQWVGVVNYHVGKKRAKQVKIYSDDNGEVFSLMQAHKCAAAVDSFIEKQKGWEGLYNLNKDQDFDMKATTLLCEKPKMKVFKKI